MQHPSSIYYTTALIVWFGACSPQQTHSTQPSQSPQPSRTSAPPQNTKQAIRALPSKPLRLLPPKTPRHLRPHLTPLVVLNSKKQPLHIHGRTILFLKDHGFSSHNFPPPTPPISSTQTLFEGLFKTYTSLYASLDTHQNALHVSAANPTTQSHPSQAIALPSTWPNPSDIPKTLWDAQHGIVSLPRLSLPSGDTPLHVDVFPTTPPWITARTAPQGQPSAIFHSPWRDPSDQHIPLQHTAMFGESAHVDTAPQGHIVLSTFVDKNTYQTFKKEHLCTRYTLQSPFTSPHCNHLYTYDHSLDRLTLHTKHTPPPHVNLGTQRRASIGCDAPQYTLQNLHEHVHAYQCTDTRHPNGARTWVLNTRGGALFHWQDPQMYTPQDPHTLPFGHTVWAHATRTPPVQIVRGSIQRRGPHSTTRFVHASNTPTLWTTPPMLQSLHTAQYTSHPARTFMVSAQSPTLYAMRFDMGTLQAIRLERVDLSEAVVSGFYDGDLRVALIDRSNGDRDTWVFSRNFSRSWHMPRGYRVLFILDASTLLLETTEQPQDVQHQYILARLPEE